MRNNELSDADYLNKYEIKDNRDWTLSKARQMIRSDEQWQDKITQCLSRPFDWRYCYFSYVSMDYPRRELLDHVFGKDNLVFNLPRIVKLKEWRHSLISNVPCTAISMDVNGSYVFPLYLYPTDNPTLIEPETTNAPGGRRPNLAPQFITEFSQKLGLEFIPDGQGDGTQSFGSEDIFNYIYAIFHSPTYRSRYAEFLKIDFPRVPLTSNTELFWQLAQKGDRLVQLHLMKETGQEISTYPIAGTNIVEKVKYEENNQQVWINSEQYFAQIPPQIWNFYIGGYQVCQKWLKDRKSRELTYEDLTHYQNMISILSETIQLMPDIDRLIENSGGFPIQ